MAEIWQLTATEVADLVRTRKVSATEACKAALARLDAVNPRINAVVQRTDDEALAMAAAIDQALARGEAVGPLAGVPTTTKVNVDQKGYATTNGLRLQADLIATTDNPLVANLKRAGAVIVGRTNTPAFSLRWFTRNSLHGHTRNPVNPSLTPGGSSGGAAAAVAAGICAIGHGNDIGGSIRYPAYACGIQGIRPTTGRVPTMNATGPDRYLGAQIMAVQGPLARTIADLRLGLEAMSARDVRDPWWTPVPLDLGSFPKRAALTVAPEGLSVQPAVEAALRAAAARLEDAGWEVVETPCPPFREPARLQALLWLGDFRRAGAAAIDQEADPDSSFVYAEMCKRAPAPDFNAYLDTLPRRSALLREWNLFLEQYPVLICPVSAETPFPDLLDVSSAEAFERVIEAQLTQVGLPFVGLPGLAVSTGVMDGVPCGAQLVAGRFREDILFAAARDIEARSPRISPVDPAPLG
ncbi:MAG: amidase family protein [Hyphomicrobiaceae bacterium]